MPRTAQATVFLIVSILALVFVTLVNWWQVDSTQSDVLELKKEIKILSNMNGEILNKLESGVAVNNSGNASNSNSNTGSGVDKYAAALNDPKNVLVANTSVKIPANAKMGGTLRGVLTSDLKGFNWMTESSVDVANLQVMVHNSFTATDFNKPDNYVPSLAYKVEISDDKKEYTLYFRDDVYWQTPNVDFSNPKYEWLKKPRKFTAADAAFYFELLKNPDVQAGSAKSYYEDLDRVEVVDDLTLKVFWKKKTYPSKSATLGAYPMPKWLFTKTEDGNDIPKATLGKEFNAHWASKYAIGTGPYKITFHKSGEKTVLERFERFWGPKYPIAKIENKVIKDPETMYLKFKGGEIDFIGKVPTNRYKTDILGKKEPKFRDGELEYKFVDMFAYYYYGWNQDSKFFGDKRVRWAMTHALNRQAMIKNVLNGLGSVQTGPFYYKHPSMDPSVKPIPYDLEKAKALLDEAGWTDSDGNGIRDKMIKGEKVEFKFAMVAYDRPEAKTMLNIFKEDLRKIGVIVIAQHVDWPTMQKKMDEKKFDAFTGGWGLSWQINPNQIWHSKQADVPKGSNRVGFRNKEADKIIEDLMVEFDPAKRQEMARKFHRIVHADQAYTFFYAPQYVMAWQPKLENVIINKTRPQALSFPWFIDPSQKKAKVQGK